MAKKLVVIRNERSTYEVHGEQERAPQRFVGGLSLDLPRLKTELLQHGCPEEIAAKALREIEKRRLGHDLFLIMEARIELGKADCPV